MSKYKYYIRKPRSEIGKDILKVLLMAGLICVSATSPYFAVNLLRNIKRKHPKKKVYRSFYLLKKQGCIETKQKGHQIYISLTKDGKKKAGWLQIDALKIEKPKKWDKKWRIVFFDIAQLKKFQREALRGKLKELGFAPLQKSVWINPFNCFDEINLLKDFFGLSDKEMRFIETYDIGEDKNLKKSFSIYT